MWDPEASHIFWLWSRATLIILYTITNMGFLTPWCWQTGRPLFTLATITCCPNCFQLSDLTLTMISYYWNKCLQPTAISASFYQHWMVARSMFVRATSSAGLLFIKILFVKVCWAPRQWLWVDDHQLLQDLSWTHPQQSLNFMSLFCFWGEFEQTADRIKEIYI